MIGDDCGGRADTEWGGSQQVNGNELESSVSKSDVRIQKSIGIITFAAYILGVGTLGFYLVLAILRPQPNKSVAILPFKPLVIEP